MIRIYPRGAGRRGRAPLRFRGKEYRQGYPHETQSRCGYGAGLLASVFIFSNSCRSAAGDGKRFMLLVHHTDTEREWAYDRHSKIGRGEKEVAQPDIVNAKTRHRPNTGLDRRTNSTMPLNLSGRLRVALKLKHRAIFIM